MSKYYGDKELFASPEVSQYGSHMVMTNVVKPTRVKYINLDTAFGDDYVNNTTQNYIDNATKNDLIPTFNQASYTFTLPQRLTNIKSLKVNSAEIPMSYYNISKYIGNNVFFIKPTGAATAQTISVPDGYYTPSTLITAIDSYFTTNNTSIRIELNTFNNKITITNNRENLDVIIEFPVKDDGSFDKNNFKSKLGWILGFRKTKYTIPKSGGTIVGESVINIDWKYLYLALDEFSNGNQNSFASQLSSSLVNKNILSKIVLNRQVYGVGTILPATIPMGFLISDKRTYNGAIDIQKLSVQLLDEYGNIINLNGVNFSVGIELEYE
jgi:hypothetical protein